MLDRLRALLSGFSAPQLAAVTTVFFVSGIAAIALVAFFHHLNCRRARRVAGAAVADIRAAAPTADHETPRG